MKTVTVTHTVLCSPSDTYVKVTLLYSEENEIIQLKLSEEQALSLIGSITHGLSEKFVKHPETSNVFSFNKSK